MTTSLYKDDDYDSVTKRVPFFDIFMYPDTSIKEVFDYVFPSPSITLPSDNFNEYIAKGTSIQFNFYNHDQDFIFGKYGEIKDGLSSNATAIVDNVEHDDALIKYSLYFLIQISTNKLCYIKNRNASNFERILTSKCEQFPYLLNFSISSVQDETHREKIKNARSIKGAILESKDPNDFRKIKESITYVNDFGKITVKMKFKEQSVNRDELTKSIDSNKMKNTKLEIINREGYEDLIDFAQSAIFKTEYVTIQKNDLKHEDKVYSILKDLLLIK